jgi:hypothetical protein
MSRRCRARRPEAAVCHHANRRDLAGYAGKYLKWSVPADLKSSSWTSFDACDLDAPGGYRDFLSWLGNGMGDRYEQVPGQVDQLWVLDVNGQ